VFERCANDDNPVLPGLIDVEKLGIHRYDENNAGSQGQFAGSKRGQNGGIAGGARGELEPAMTGLGEHFGRFSRKNTDTGEREKEPVVIVATGGR
jgi:hypothetical protein